MKQAVLERGLAPHLVQLAKVREHALLGGGHLDRLRRAKHLADKAVTLPVALRRALRYFSKRLHGQVGEDDHDGQGQKDDQGDARVDARS